jgi:hypothetical protein
MHVPNTSQECYLYANPLGRIILFVYSLLMEALNDSDCRTVAKNDKMIMNNELKRTWKEAIAEGLVPALA